MTDSTATRGTVLLRPLWRRIARSLGWSTVAGVAPAFLALGVLTSGTPAFAMIAASSAAIVLLAVLAGSRVRSAFLEVGPGGIREGSCLGRVRHTPRSEITAVLIVDVFSGSTVGSARQVLVLDAGGRTRVRMHARHWEPGTVEAVAAAFPARVARVPGPLARGEFRRAYAPHLSRLERHPSIIVVAAASAALIVLLPALSAVAALH